MATIGTFAYEAQTPQGQTLSGTLDAASIEQADQQLKLLHLRVTRLEPSKQPSQSRALRGEDFLAFNQQLAQIAAAGLPLERGLRLIAADIASRRKAEAINRIAAELEKGATLEAAFAAHKGDFPPLYGKLMQAGVRAGNLPAMLLSLGKHAEMVQRLRAAVWRAASYPLMVLATLLAVLVFIWGWLVPRVIDLQGANLGEMLSFNTPPALSYSRLPQIGAEISYGMMALIALVLLASLLFGLLGNTRFGRPDVEKIFAHVPLIGPILRGNLLARWCDALQIGVHAGVDLPGAISMAADTVDSPRLRSDSHLLIEAISQGKPLDQISRLRSLPAIVPASLQLGIEQSDLPATVATLAKTYQEQAELRVNVLPTMLTPLLLLLVSACVALAVISTLLPLTAVIKVIESLTGGGY